MIPAVVIAGTHSGAGKTTVTMGILAALRRRGMTVQSFKTGPDYIDPTFHKLITGRTCSNLDSWMMDRETILRLYQRAIEGAQMAVIEGVMGLFDGAAGEKPGGKGSTADLAQIVNKPVILVVDARSAAQSIAATVHGFCTLQRDLTVAGVIINRVGSERHGLMARRAVEETCCVPVLGCLPRDAVRPMPERHLGLVSAIESSRELESYWQQLADVMERYVDVNRLLEVASSFSTEKLEIKLEKKKENLAEHLAENLEKNQLTKQTPRFAQKIPVAIARDEAFHFYYEDALRDLEDLGIEWVPFQPVRGESIPLKVAGLYLGGGYPELHLESLSANSSFFQELRYLHQQGMPIYAECGGFMTLCRSITTNDGQSYELAGLVPADCRMGTKRRALGYVTAQIDHDTLLGRRGDRLRGHEFHYSDVYFSPEENMRPAFSLGKTDPLGGTEAFRPEGYSSGSLTASYFHFHFSAFPSSMKRFLHCLEEASVRSGLACPSKG
ncbi:cobyrinate a,c-diamide synthase [Heliobacillus mobilis]|uniref:Cobyrinate a,c-diamide synthase n=1 Tax=Heliobacterium mobile TaxID=28064 RepID=A0A6I3SNX7_HELMO|nr:cobyrinate a,c-diamide synthase [Heliobacterium mobile]MTV50232.1 cobyrinate a,c-diamide synthase [Heliobacterium mobile]